MDCIAHFSPLTSNSFIKIAKAKLNEISSILYRKNIFVVIHEDVATLCAEAAENGGGARAVISFVKKEIEERIAEHLFQIGSEHVEKVNIFQNNEEIQISSVTDLCETHIM